MRALANWILKEKLGIERVCEKPNIHIGFARELLLEKLFYPSEWIVDSMTFKYRRKITITEQSGNDLTYYQVLIELNSMNFDFTHTQTNGEDVRFTDASGNLLSYWIEEWDSVNKKAKVWVKVPSIPANSSVEIFMYYGNPEITSASDASATFIRIIDGLVASWHLDEESGTTAYDTSGNDNDGTIYGGATRVDGKFKKALNFDGDDDYVEVAHSDSLNLNVLTVETWFKSTYSGQWFKTIIAKYGYTSITESWGLGWIDSYTLGFYIRDADGNHDKATASYKEGLDGNWHHLVGYASDSKVGFYMDGDLKEEVDRTAGDIRNTRPVTMARHLSDYVPETLDEVRIYNRALTQEEISDLYNNYGYTTENYPGKVLVRKYTEPEPSVSLGAEETA